MLQAAIMTGLINRVIHVWPSWSRNVYKKSYTFKKIGLGSAEVKKNEEVFCECVQRAGMYEHCMFMNYTKLALYNKDPETRIKAHLCDFHAEYEFEALDEDKAASLGKRGNWVDKNENIILDIDEDFFGVESVFSTMFAQNKLSYKKHMKQMANISSNIFCPDDCDQEQEIDKFLVEVIDMILSSGHWSQPNYCFLPSDTKRVIRTKFITLIENNLYFCRKSVKTLLSLWDKFLQFFLNVTKEQLVIMKEIGFCLETGPKTLGFYDPDDDIKAFMPCVGRNVPGDTMVSLYSPDSQDIQFYTDKLYNILNSLGGVAPKLVTIGRSMRDGFTPRDYFHQIEENIILTLRNTWPNVRFRLHYDENLLGGEKGWPNRHNR